MKRVAVIQARMGSTRLPGKVLMPILGRPMLQLLVERIGRTSMIDEIVVATSNLAGDDIIASTVEKIKGIRIFRGSETNVLERFFLAGRESGAENTLRVTADNPFFDWKIADSLIKKLSTGGFDYVANNLQRSFPYGIDLEVFSASALEHAYKEAHDANELEHVTPYIRKRPEIFKIGGISWKRDLSALRLTVDTFEDYRRAVTLFEQFGEDVTFREIADEGFI